MEGVWGRQTELLLTDGTASWQSLAERCWHPVRDPALPRALCSVLSRWHHLPHLPALCCTISESRQESMKAARHNQSFSNWDSLHTRNFFSQKTTQKHRDFWQYMYIYCFGSAPLMAHYIADLISLKIEGLSLNSCFTNPMPALLTKTQAWISKVLHLWSTQNITAWINEKNPNPFFDCFITVQADLLLGGCGFAGVGVWGPTASPEGSGCLTLSC